jgi:hypothetical protein
MALGYPAQIRGIARPGTIPASTLEASAKARRRRATRESFVLKGTAVIDHLMVLLIRPRPRPRHSNWLSHWGTGPIKALLIARIAALFCGAAYAQVPEQTQPAETREIVLRCAGYAISINPVTSVAYIVYSSSTIVRSRAAIDAHSISFDIVDGIMRIDRDTNTYSLSSYTNQQPKSHGTCAQMP